MTYTLETAQSIFPGTKVATAVPDTVERFNRLSVEDQQALLWYAYTEMGRTITPAALGAARLQFAENLLNQIKKMSPAEQTKAMDDIASRADTPVSRAYGAFSVNTKLGFWYELADLMKQGIVAPIPPGYKLAGEAEAVLETIKQLDPGQQITVLRNTVVNMGFESSFVPGADSKAEPKFVRNEPVSTTKITIDGVTEPTVLKYIEAMNADNFDAAIALFDEQGALQPPFQMPIVGHNAIAKYMRAEAQGLNMIPKQGVSETLEEGYTQHKVTGSVQTPWFGGSAGMNIAWRFLLNPQGKIFFVAIDLLASPKELLNLRRA